ncbi:unnamed protein product, partial [marine sediment metagenome]
MTHPAIKYADQVLSGKVLACKWVRLACERFIFDLEEVESGQRTDIYFDWDTVARVSRFYELCPHFKGEWAGNPIILEPWQDFCNANIFGWKFTDTGFRRFKTIYETVGRKNGKTTMIAPAGLYFLYADDEPGAEVYSAAVD